MTYKSKTLIMFLSVFIVLLFNLFSCSDKNESYKNSADFSVRFFDVNNGDMTLIVFPDGKTLLIDCGSKNEKLDKKILEKLKNYGITKIDYLVLTHYDLDHIGGAPFFINNFDVINAYLPYIKDYSNYELYGEILLLLKNKNAKINYSDCYTFVKTDNYNFAFLSPSPYDLDDSEYKDINNSPIDSIENHDNSSAVLYLDYYGVRFLFTGDILNTVEKKILEKYRLGLYNHFFDGINVNLLNIDFLKVSRHGGANASYYDFLLELCPKNAIISVGTNYEGFPSFSVLERIIRSNENVNIFRTDIDGDISVLINSSGGYSVFKDRD